LDGYGGKTENDAVKSYGEAFAAFREKEKELEAAVLRDREAVERADLTAFQVAEIERADLVEGEDEVLEREILVMKSSERIAGAAQAALDALRGGDDQMGGVSAMEAASAELTALAAIDKTMKEQAERLRGVSAEADDIARSIQSYRQDIEYDKNRLDEASTRLELIKTMKRKYGDSISQILRFKDTAKSELAAQEASDENIKRLKASIQKSEAELHGMADSLTAARRRAAAELEKTVERELEGLNLKGCRFKVGFGDTLDLTANGKDRIEFLLSPNPGQGLMPLAKTASGGEISRIMLALKIAFIKADPVPVLVFDEIDSGIGGETAAAVGRKLKQLAGNHQVICITHLPQIAAYGDAHFFVSKTEKSGTALTGISRLDEKGRIDELSRMLTGGASTEASSRQHAKELLSAARAVSAVE
jgi:DNA repair protein RecN (Recombination protein N)